MTASDEKPKQSRLIIVSNRLPVSIEKAKEGTFQVNEGSGGLVTAMAPVLKDRGGLWIGWPGPVTGDKKRLEKLLNESTDNSGYSFEPVILEKEEVENYYYGFANEIIWPLFHDLQTRCNFDPAYWRTYQQVNRKFAGAIADNIINGDHIWVHDYHLMMTADALRNMGVASKIGYFLHIPFPSPDLFFKLPWRYEIIKGLLAYDLIGFQTFQDRQNFIQCVRTVDRDVIFRGRGRVINVASRGREVHIGHFPISIDFDEFAENAGKMSVKKRAEEIKKEMNVTHILLGVDRLDYTKGIPERLAAFELALEKYPDLQGKVTLLQLVVPSRTALPHYSELKEEVDRKISEINGRYGRTGWTPVNYLFRSISREELLAFYRAADIAFITPLKDGMNLVAKEYCAANVDEDGVVILSEFAGARDQFWENALMVNPYDVERVADTLREATRMTPSQRRSRIRQLRKDIRKFDIFWWMDAFLESVFVRKLETFPKRMAYPAAAGPISGGLPSSSSPA